MEVTWLKVVAADEPGTANGHSALENGRGQEVSEAGAADIEMGAVTGVHKRVNGEAARTSAEESLNETPGTSGDALLSRLREYVFIQVTQLSDRCNCL